MNPPNPNLDEQPAGLGDDPQEEELNKAIEELRGVLHEDETGALPDPVTFGEAMGDIGVSLDALGGDAGAASMPDTAGFAAPAAGDRFQNAGVIMNIPVDVQIVLGSAEMPVSELMALKKGSTVALDRRIGEPVDVVVNGRKIASGEITVLDNDPSRFGIKLTQIIGAAKTG